MFIESTTSVPRSVLHLQGSRIQELNCFKASSAPNAHFHVHDLFSP